MSEIVIENLYKSFDTKDGTVEALKNVNLSIESGDIYGIIGMSGAGKSTLVRCINFLEVPTKGRVLINGKSLGDYTSRELRKQREDIGMIFQHFNLLMQKNVLENVCFPLYIQGKSKKDARKRAKELLDIVGLGDRTGAFPAQLSGGQKQRVAIARALASDPKILLCDEATSALDPQTTSSILALLKDINQRFDITIVIITHQMSVVREICSHVAIVKGGEVAEQGTVEDIFTHPKTAVARELLKNDVGDDGEEKRGTTAGGKEIIKSGEKIRIVFSENSAFEPVIANLILNFNEPVNILKADTKNVGGVAKGEMVLEFAPDCTKNKEMKQYLLDRGLEIEEVSEQTKEITDMIINGVWATLYMTVASTVLGYVFGLPMGVLLAITDKEGLTPNAVVYKILDVIANIVRSIPFLILLILLIPFTRLLVGQSYGSTATIVPLVIAAIPFIGRMVESSIKEVDPGVIEAARSMGASNMQIVMKVLLVEARTSLLTGATIAIGTILGYSAMAGCVGGGGLGDIAIRYGYYRYQTSIMIVTVVLLVILVQIFQSIGMFLAAKLDKRKQYIIFHCKSLKQTYRIL